MPLAFEAAWEGPVRPTAAVCFNDRVAIGAMHALAARGLRAGRDLGIVGFDDIAEARWTQPALSTVSVDAARLGARAAELLFAQIGGAEPAEVVTPTELVVRASCGATQARKETSTWQSS